MNLKKIIGKLHLILGFTSGLLVMVIALTGCIYAFQEEIQNLTQPYRFVEEQDKDFLLPTQLIAKADVSLPGKFVHAVMYGKKTDAAKVICYHGGDDGYYYFVYANPYTGEVLEISDMNSNFFNFILDGHFYLWLPDDLGHFIVASATLIFFVMIISGLFLWWPRNKYGVKQRFTIKWNARWRRKNYDLHNVTGFYICWLALIFVITGLVWGFEWFSHSYYAVITGGKEFVQYEGPVSQLIAKDTAHTGAIDKVWLRMQQEYPTAHWIEVHTPEDSTSSIAANANPDAGTYWQLDYRYFDQYSLKDLPVKHIWGRFNTTSRGEKLMRMNYDIHTGAILGLPGKILAFCISLVIATLPVTGFMIWWGRRKKAKAQLAETELAEEQSVSAATR